MFNPPGQCSITPKFARFPTPWLRTLGEQPSWQNRAGRIDRSACAEIRASNLWKHITTGEPLRPRSGRRRDVARSDLTIRGHRNSEIDRVGDDAARRKRFAFHLTARYLSQLQDRFTPRQLQGDDRTTKSNAMRHKRIEARGMHHKKLHNRQQATPNPNKGASREKFLGLWEDWSQDINIIRCKLHDKLSQHFLICPGCKQRALKLFLPLCTRDEARDADIAELWIDAIDDFYRSLRRPMPAEIMTTRAALINRFGLLFREGRVLKCRRCLGLRYGEKR